MATLEVIQSIPLGICQCGCGAVTNLRGRRPQRFVRGHHGPAQRYPRLSVSQWPSGECAIPLIGNDGTTAAYAIVDKSDIVQARYAWHVVNGYARRGVRRLHREILGLAPDDPRQVDHRDGNRLNNRRENLRITTPQGNSQNRPRRAGSSSRFRGVCWDRSSGKWLVQVMLDGRNHNLGRFRDELEAADVASAFRIAHMPFTNEDRREA